MNKAHSSSCILVNPTHLPASDRSAQYGDASFTTMYANAGTILLLARHIKRLQKACEALSIDFDDWLHLQAELAKLAALLIGPSAIKVMISRGSGGRGYQPPQEQSALCIVSSHPAQEISTQPIVKRVGFSNVCLPKHMHLGGLKHNNRLAQVMAKQANIATGCDEVLMCNEKGHIIEAGASNIFYRIQGTWYTPPLHDYGVQGIMRDELMHFMQTKNYALIQASHHKSQFRYIDALVLTNALKGAIPVAHLVYDDASLAVDTDLAVVNDFKEALQL